MGTTLIIIAIAVGGTGAKVSQSAVERQNTMFQQYWGTDFSWKFDELPTEAVMPGFRLPYSGHIYPDRAGGTASALRKYDQAFHGGKMRAVAYERWDTTAFKEREPRRGVLGRLGAKSLQTPNWYGHCNGWTTAAIRHAEPQTSVYRNEVEFTPSDIKALLAEIYLYNDNTNLTEPNERLNPAEFHAVVANWIGRGRHPVGMEGDPGKEKWNYPVYAYSTGSAQRGDRVVEVKMNIAYAKDSRGETDDSSHIQKIRYFHYSLELDDDGNMVGGRWHHDTGSIDFFWIPLRPKPSRQPGHERGNPHVDVDRVLAIWRESVPEDVRKKWLVVDPAPADRVLDAAGVESLVPLQVPITPQSDPPARDAPNDEVANTETIAPEEAVDAEVAELAVAATEDAELDESDTAASEPFEAAVAEAEAADLESADPEIVQSERDEGSVNDSGTATEVADSEAGNTRSNNTIVE